MGREADVRRLVAAIEAAGGTVRRTRRGHLRVTGPLGVAIICSSHGSWRAINNDLATLRRHAGIDLKGKVI